MHSSPQREHAQSHCILLPQPKHATPQSFLLCDALYFAVSVDDGRLPSAQVDGLDLSLLYEGLLPKKSLAPGLCLALLWAEDPLLCGCLSIQRSPATHAFLYLFHEGVSLLGVSSCFRGCNVNNVLCFKKPLAQGQCIDVGTRTCAHVST